MKRSDALRGLAAVAATGLAACTAPDWAPTIDPTRGSPSKPTAFGVQIYGSDDLSRAVGLIAACGGTHVRVDGSLDLRYYDALFAATAAGGLRVIMISPYAAQPVDVAAYAQQCAAMQARYAAFNPIWELWNEPNLASYWGAAPDPAAYSRLAIAVAKALRSVGASDVWSGGTSGVDLGWIQQLRGNGVFDAANGCAVHSYKAPGYARTEYVQAQVALPPKIGLHTTETTVPDVLEQPDFFRQMWYLHRDLGLPTLVWAEFRDGTAGVGQNFGKPYGLVSAAYQPKSVYYTAVATVTGG